MVDADRIISIRSVVVASWIVLALLFVGGWYVISSDMAWGILAGGLLANVSFLFIQKDITKFFNTIGEIIQSDSAKMKISGQKIFLYFRSVLRFAVLAAFLYFLIIRWKMNVIGLTVGLSVVVISISFAAVKALKQLVTTS